MHGAGSVRSGTRLIGLHSRGAWSVEGAEAHLIWCAEIERAH
jgi:hypothetical protein